MHVSQDLVKLKRTRVSMRPFCFCRPFNTVGALERAKYAVESQYAVVGVLEDFNTTLTVLEKYIPRFFGGATSVYFGE